MTNAYRHPSVLDVIEFYENKAKENSKTMKNQAVKSRSGKPAH